MRPATEPLPSAGHWPVVVNNAAGHVIGPGDEPARAHVRFMPHRRGRAFDVVVADDGPGTRETLTRNPKLEVPGADGEAILLATQDLVSGTGDPTRGIGLWTTVTETRRQGPSSNLERNLSLYP